MVIVGVFMKSILFLVLLGFLSLLAKDKYMDNHACNECHEKIYEEYQSSAHAKGYFTDELHREIADHVDTQKYSCAVCHMPMADNLQDLIDGKARPDKNNKTHTDAISCYFCHTIAYVKKSHKFNINTKARQAKNFKPTLYGRLDHPDESDKHSSSKNPIYGQKVCMGCHSHKLNDQNVTIFRAMEEHQDSIKCIECHMPEIAGGAEKMDKRARGRHASHKFLGIHDSVFRATGVDINITTTNGGVDIKLTNKMGHPLIIQPARVKYLELKVLRDGKTIWRNYKNHPSEDSKVYFEYRFKDKSGERVIIPATAYSGESTNLDAHKSKTLHYDIDLKKGDLIQATMYVRLAKEDCQSVITLRDEIFKRRLILKRLEQRVE